MEYLVEYFNLVRIFAIYSLLIIIFCAMFYGDPFYDTFITSWYKSSFMYQIGIELNIINSWRHFSGPATFYDAKVIAKVTQDGQTYDLVLYDSKKQICWKDRKINVLDAKWFEILINQEQKVIDATYDYLYRKYRNATYIGCYIVMTPMNGFHVNGKIAKEHHPDIYLYPSSFSSKESEEKIKNV